MKQKRYLKCKLKLENGVSYIMFSLLWPWEHTKQGKAALMEGFWSVPFLRTEVLVLSML